jgi:hypothetical protein
MVSDALTWLQDWYVAHCNGEWEHRYGLAIETLDNPGWALRIDLAGTELQGAALEPVWHEAGEQIWWSCDVDGDQFIAHCGPRNLPDVIRTFREWQSSAGKPTVTTNR